MAPPFRYPDDPFDRIWRPTLIPEPAPNPISSAANISSYNSTVTVPLQVLQTALTSSERLEFSHDNLESKNYNYTIVLYFLELNDSVRNPGQRVFDIYINGEKKQEKFDILAGGSNYARVVLNATAIGSLNLTLDRGSTWSEFGPICNAYEIFQAHPWVQETVEEDGKPSQLVTSC